VEVVAGGLEIPWEIAFLPDGRALAQDDSSLNGKYLRLDAEQYRGAGGERPQVVSKGHRNPQGFDWQPGTDRLISTEHGPSGGDGPQGFDEVNEILPGANYGWPEAFGSDHAGFEAPLRYVLTSNRDGRGDPAGDDDRILRITPP